MAKNRGGSLVWLKARRPDETAEDILKAKLIAEYLRTCLSAIDNPRTAIFIESLANQWDGEGWLSDKQFQRLKLIHDEL